MNVEQAAALREAFPAERIGKLPKAGTTLDYVGHGAVTERLLEVDPEWTWEPFATDERGLPALDDDGNLWIRLTVCGVTRIGVGDGQTMKILIGDALRNAAMRFGVALDLWIKGHAEDDDRNNSGPYQRSSRPVGATGSTEKRDLIQKLSAANQPTNGSVDDLRARVEALREKIGSAQPEDRKVAATGERA